MLIRLLRVYVPLRILCRWTGRYERRGYRMDCDCLHPLYVVFAHHFLRPVEKRQSEAPNLRLRRIHEPVRHHIYQRLGSKQPIHHANEHKRSLHKPDVAAFLQHVSVNPKVI